MQLGEARRSIDTMGNLWAELLVVWVGHCQLTDGTYSPSLKTTNLWLLLQPFWGGSLTATAIAWLVTTPGRLARSDPILWQLWESNSGNGLCSHACYNGLGTSLAGQSLPAKLLGNEANAQTLGLIWALASDLVFQLSDDLHC